MSPLSRILRERDRERVSGAKRPTPSVTRLRRAPPPSRGRLFPLEREAFPPREGGFSPSRGRLFCLTLPSPPRTRGSRCAIKGNKVNGFSTALLVPCFRRGDGRGMFKKSRPSRRRDGCVKDTRGLSPQREEGGCLCLAGAWNTLIRFYTIAVRRGVSAVIVLSALTNSHGNRFAIAKCERCLDWVHAFFPDRAVLVGSAFATPCIRHFVFASAYYELLYAGACAGFPCVTVAVFQAACFAGAYCLGVLADNP